jgi:transcriptional regulator with GAF, ATPase, and Fis domain
MGIVPGPSGAPDREGAAQHDAPRHIADKDCHIDRSILAARLLGMTLRQLRYRIAKLGLAPGGED